jgi:S-DNA-T family DNA segregation ATPase FtsK/SpoIIIE
MNPDLIAAFTEMVKWFLLGGFGVLGTAMLFHRKPENELWRDMDIKNIKGEHPHLLSKIKNKDGITYVVYIPDGINMEKMFDEKGKYHHMILQSFADLKHCEIKPIDGHKLSIKVFTEQLATKYDYPVDLIKESKNILHIPIGVSLKGIIYMDIGDSAPHCGVAGTAGYGKSTMIKVIITWLIAHSQVIDLFLIDLKNGVELNIFADSTKVKQFGWEKPEATKIINFLVKEMNERYRMFQLENGIPNIDKYNVKYPEKKLPRLLLGVDEFADLSDDKRAVELLVSIARKGRAAGVHMILATQRPDSKIIDGQLKANIISWICFKVETYQNSMLILGHVGAEDLEIQGRGIYDKPGTPDIEFQGYYISEDTCKELIKHTIKPKEQMKNVTPLDTEGDEFV